MSLPNVFLAINQRFHRPLFWLSLLLLSALSSGAHAQEILPIPDRLKGSIQSVTCLSPAAIKTANLATTRRLVVAGPLAPNIQPKLLAGYLGEECLEGGYAVFTVEVAIYPERMNYEKVGSEYVPVMCSTTGGSHPGCSISIKGEPAPNSYGRNFGMWGVRANQLPRGGGQIFGGPGETVTVENVTTFANYDKGPRYAIGNFYVWEVCRSKFKSPTFQNSDGQLVPTKCELVDITDPMPMGGKAEYCLLNTGTAQVQGYCVTTKAERLATPAERERHIKGVLDAQCRGRSDDHMNLCHVVHTDGNIVMAQSFNSPFIVQPYGRGSTWGYNGTGRVVGDRIYPISLHVVERVSDMIFSPGAVGVDVYSSPGLPKLNTYESQERPVPASSSTGGGTTQMPRPVVSPSTPGSGSFTPPTPPPSGPSGGIIMPTQGGNPSTPGSGSFTSPTPPPSGPSGGSRMPTQGGSPSTPGSGSYTTPGSPNGPQCAGGICR